MNRIFYSLTTLSIATSLLVATTLDTNDALNHLNNLRVSAGLSPLTKNQTLQTASQNHINYVKDTGLGGHYENNDSYPSSFYTGIVPHDRGVFVGYRGSYYLENFSSGQDNLEQSIDDLMSAIYHRYGFLDMNIDEIGIGVNNSSKLFNYNMANSFVDELCYGDSYSGNERYYFSVCSDKDFRIEATLYKTALHKSVKHSPDIVIWPPLNSKNISPAFYEESPDPLPNRSVSGYPISLEFNSYRYEENNITIESFELYSDDGMQFSDTLLMDKSNDINNKHTKFQFTLFPLKRLEWNQIYRVVVKYGIDEEDYRKEWSFRTKNIPYPLYIVEDNDATFTLKSDTTYAFYFKPTDENDILNGLSSRFSTENEPEVVFYDANTLLITLSGKDDRYCNIDFKHGDLVTKTLALKLGQNSMVSIPDKEFTLSTLSYTTKNGSLFETNIENSLYENETLTTDTITDSKDRDIFVRLSQETRGDVLVSLNVDNKELTLPKFASKSEFDVEKIDDKVILRIKTKLTKSMVFKGTEDEK